MKLAEKFFNQSYENEKRFKLEAEKEKAEQLKKKCTKIFEDIIQPKIEIAVNNGFYTAHFKELEFKFFNDIVNLIHFLRAEGFFVVTDSVNGTFDISWKLDKSPMTEDPAFR